MENNQSKPFEPEQQSLRRLVDLYDDGAISYTEFCQFLDEYEFESIQNETTILEHPSDQA